MTSRLVFDWLTLVTRVHNKDEIKQFFGLERFSWVLCSGKNGYPFCESYDNMVHICYGASEEMGVCIILSGQGCRLFESLGHGDYISIFKKVQESNGKMWLTRLDVAYDDFNGMNMQQIVDDTLSENFVTRFRKAKIEAALYGHGKKGWSCTYGSPESRIKIRIYDKKTEQESREYITISCPENTETWVRIEIQFNKGRTGPFLDEFEKSGYTHEGLEKIYLGVLAQYLRFVSPLVVRGDGDKQKERWSTADYWRKFTEDVKKLSLYKADDSPYTISRAKENVFRRQFGSVKAMTEVMGPETFLQVVQDMPYPRNPKYVQMVEQYKYNERRDAVVYSEEFDELRF